MDDLLSDDLLSSPSALVGEPKLLPEAAASASAEASSAAPGSDDGITEDEAEDIMGGSGLAHTVTHSIPPFKPPPLLSCRNKRKERAAAVQPRRAQSHGTRSLGTQMPGAHEPHFIPRCCERPPSR